MVEFLKKHTLLLPLRVPATFQTGAGLICYQMAGNIVGLLNRTMLINGFRYLNDN